MKKEYLILSGVFFLIGIVMLYCNSLFSAYMKSAHLVHTNIVAEYHLYMYPVACFIIGIGLIFLPFYFKK